MKISKAKTSNYNAVNSKNLVRYISEYAGAIYGIVCTQDSKLEDKNKAELKAIAAELETVQKRLEYIVNGRY